MGEALVAPGRVAVNVDLSGRSALITGAASGIGRTCAQRLARAGAAVTVLDLDGDARPQGCQRDRWRGSAGGPL